MVKYDEKSIQTLDALEHIRLRTGMYIGRVGNGSHPEDGIYILIKEIIDNSIDEFIMGNGKKIEITRNENTVKVRDYGRGIPLGKVVECVSQINTGGKFNDDVFQFSVGLNGVGTKAVNALSSDFEIISWREGKYKKAIFSKGKLIKDKKGKDNQKNGTQIIFTPDSDIFGQLKWNDDYIKNRLSYYSYLNSGLTLIYNNESFQSKGGLSDLIVNENEEILYNIIHYKGKNIEFALTHTNNYGEQYFSFVNGQHTNDGGTHQSAFREGILKAVNEFATKNFAGEDVRDGLIGAIAIKIKDPIFESQTKNKLGSTNIRSWILNEVKTELFRLLNIHKKSAKLLLEKVNNNERLRKELYAVKKQAKERSKKIAIRIPKLIDCKKHYNEPGLRKKETTIFLTEGDSAGGAMVQSRNVQTQAIFSLKGKPVNTFGQKREIIYKNEELYNIMKALGIEDGIDGLRYNKVVIATDADVDGAHIRNLLLTYFLCFFEELIISGHIYILETPIYRVRNKNGTVYCYNDVERKRAIKKLGKSEITRFKGLGEISPKEFAQFIGENMRLINVFIEDLNNMRKILRFLMGKNSIERKNFIVENLEIRDV